jgi:hypothetical protein
MTIVLVEAFFYRVDVIQREVVPWLYLKGHSEHPSQGYRRMLHC